MEDAQKTELFERTPIPKAVMKLAVPTVLSSLVMVLYNLADTYFVGMLNNAVQNAAVTLAAPLLLAFNAVNNLFGVGSSSMMSRSLGKKDYETVYRSSAFGFYCAVFAGLLFSIVYTLLQNPLLRLLGATEETMGATVGYARWTVTFGAVPAILNVVMAYLVRAEGASMHASIGTMSGCFLNILLDPVFILPWGLNMGAEGRGWPPFFPTAWRACTFCAALRQAGQDLCVCQTLHVQAGQTHCPGRLCRGGSRLGAEPFERDGHERAEQLYLWLWVQRRGGHGHCPEDQLRHRADRPGPLSGGLCPLISYNYASGNIRRMKKTFLFAARIALVFLVLMEVAYFVGPACGSACSCRMGRLWIWAPVPAGFLPGHALSGHRLFGGGGVPGHRPGAVRVPVRHFAQGGAGNPRPVPFECLVPLVRLGLCPVCRRGGFGGSVGGCAGAAVPQMGEALSKARRKRGILIKIEKLSTKESPAALQAAGDFSMGANRLPLYRVPPVRYNRGKSVVRRFFK